jgi:hypothetical protein
MSITADLKLDMDVEWMTQHSEWWPNERWQLMNEWWMNGKLLAKKQCKNGEGTANGWRKYSKLWRSLDIARMKLRIKAYSHKSQYSTCLCPGHWLGVPNRRRMTENANAEENKYWPSCCHYLGQHTVTICWYYSRRQIFASNLKNIIISWFF